MSTIEQAPPPPDLTPGQPARVLGLFDATCIVVGAIIGVGIFFTPSQVVRATHSGGLALLAWAIAGGIALCGALTFAALGRRYHASGAQYEIIRDAYGRATGFVFVFCNATAIQPGAIAIIAIICARHIGFAATGTEPQGLALGGLSAGLIAALMGANIAGVRWGSRIQNLTVIAKLATLAAVTGAAVLFAPDASTIHPMAPTTDAPTMTPTTAITAVMAALVACFFAYGGWQHALWISGEVRQPGRNLPRAIVGGVLVVIVVYLLANWAYLRLLGPDGVAAEGALAARAAEAVVPRLGARVIAGAVAVSAFGVLNAQFLSGPRLVFGMAADGQFFGAFGRLGRRFGTPTAAILLLGIIALALLGPAVRDFDGVDRLLTGVVSVDSVFFGLTGAAVFVLARRGGASVRSLGYPVVPLLFVVGEMGVVVGSFLNPAVRSAAITGGIWIALAAVLYVVRFRQARPT
jgi:APA family basic amino acid/polyamine antiporter